MDSGAERGQYQLSYGNQDAATALVADAENFFAICLCVSLSL
jgi:hypothetical protein